MIKKHFITVALFFTSVCVINAADKALWISNVEPKIEEISGEQYNNIFEKRRNETMSDYNGYKLLRWGDSFWTVASYCLNQDGALSNQSAKDNFIESSLCYNYGSFSKPEYTFKSYIAERNEIYIDLNTTYFGKDVTVYFYFKTNSSGEYALYRISIPDIFSDRNTSNPDIIGKEVNEYIVALKKKYGLKSAGEETFSLSPYKNTKYLISEATMIAITVSETTKKEFDMWAGGWSEYDELNADILLTSKIFLDEQIENEEAKREDDF